MKSSTTSPFAKTRAKRWLWFIGFYVASLLVMGSVYFLLHVMITLLK